MKKRRLGGSTLEVSVVGLGGNNFGGRIDFTASSRVVGKAIELGINLIDTADSYGDKGGSEEWLGRILGEKRKAIVLASKFGMPMDDAGKLKGASRRYIMQAVEASLRRLRTDWIDLYQLHRPDPQTPIEETLRALDDLVRQGKVRFLGCSNLSAQQVVEAQATARQHGLAEFVSCQDEYSLLVRDVERELIPTAKALGLVILPYFPLASGLLTGKYKRGAALPPGSRLAKNPRHAQEFINERNWRRRRTRDIRRTARSHHARARVQLVAARGRGRQRHRRRHHAGAGRAECARRGVDAVGGGFGRDRSDYAVRQDVAACARLCAKPRTQGRWSWRRTPPLNAARLCGDPDIVRHFQGLPEWPPRRPYWDRSRDHPIRSCPHGGDVGGPRSPAERSHSPLVRRYPPGDSGLAH